MRRTKRVLAWLAGPVLEVPHFIPRWAYVLLLTLGLVLGVSGRVLK